MKWKDLSLKERKQVYDSIRANNPDVTYFDIKEQFDSIPAYEDGDDLSKTKKQLGLIPGTPEYFARQQAISGRVDVVQPEAYLTPAGYVKDALSVAEAIDEGNYGEAAATTLLNAIPWGVGKIFRGIKSKVGEALNTPIEVKSVDLAEPFTTAKRRKKSKVIEDDTQHKEAATRRSKNIKNYEKEISSTIEDAVFPDPQTMALLKYVDEGFGTNYKRSYADIAYRDMSNRGKYVTYEGMEPGHYGSMRGRKIEGDTYSINDFGVYLNPDYYMPGTASHELSHLADALNNPYTSTNMTTMKDTHYGNNYLDYLADYENMLSPEEIQKTGRTHLMGTRKYLSDPTEVKSHMIGLKRALINAGKLANWNSKVTVDMLKDYFDPRNYQNLVNPMNRNMFDLYRNKQGFVNRMNMLIPMEYAVPLGVSGFVGYELNDE